MKSKKIFILLSLVVLSINSMLAGPFDPPPLDAPPSLPLGDVDYGIMFMVLAAGFIYVQLKLRATKNSTLEK